MRVQSVRNCLFRVWLCVKDNSADTKHTFRQEEMRPTYGPSYLQRRCCQVDVVILRTHRKFDSAATSRMDFHNELSIVSSLCRSASADISWRSLLNFLLSSWDSKDAQRVRTWASCEFLLRLDLLPFLPYLIFPFCAATPHLSSASPHQSNMLIILWQFLSFWLRLRAPCFWSIQYYKLLIFAVRQLKLECLLGAYGVNRIGIDLFFAPIPSLYSHPATRWKPLCIWRSLTQVDRQYFFPTSRQRLP